MYSHIFLLLEYLNEITNANKINNHLERFNGCSSEIKYQVQISWNGTIVDDIIEQ